MKLHGRIDERGLTHALVGPETAPEELERRLELVEEVLVALSVVCRPIALEVERAHLSPETGLVVEPPPEPAVVVLAEPAALRDGVEPTVADVRDFHGVSMEPAGVRGALSELLGSGLASGPGSGRRAQEVGPGSAEGASPEPWAASGGERGLLVDWRRIEALAVWARGAQGAEELVLEQVPSRPVRAELVGGEPWFAGPIDQDGWRRFLPVVLRLESEGGVLHLRVGARWSPWTTAGTRERAYLDEAIAALRRAGFTPAG